VREYNLFTMKSSLDMTPRYAPTHVIIARAMALLPVTRYIAHPAGTHPDSPIKNDMMALECITAKGSRWYGCESAYINSELRMVVVGFDSRDEVRSKWEVCETI
jgi:hypothetical protein